MMWLPANNTTFYSHTNSTNDTYYNGYYNYMEDSYNSTKNKKICWKCKKRKHADLFHNQPIHYFVENICFKCTACCRCNVPVNYINCFIYTEHHKYYNCCFEKMTILNKSPTQY